MFVHAMQKSIKLCNLPAQWMNSRTMIAVDVAERIHVLDVRSEEELEVSTLMASYSSVKALLHYAVFHWRFSFSLAFFIFPCVFHFTLRFSFYLAFFILPCVFHFTSRFSSRFRYQHVGIQNARKMQEKCEPNARKCFYIILCVGQKARVSRVLPAFCSQTLSKRKPNA